MIRPTYRDNVRATPTDKLETKTRPIRLSARLAVILDCISNPKRANAGVCPVTTIAQYVGYSITRSARASTVGGIAMPMALAVLMLITNSYLVG